MRNRDGLEARGVILSGCRNAKDRDTESLERDRRREHRVYHGTVEYLLCGLGKKILVVSCETNLGESR